MFKSKKEKLEKEILKDELINIDSSESEAEENTPAGDTEEETGTPEEILKLENQILQFKDQYLRKAAEFENYKKRTDAEISNVYRYANENLIFELLPVLDDFNRIMKTWDKNHDQEAFRKGIEIVYDKFKNILGKQGLKEMDAVGQPFDVNLHEALMQSETAEFEPNTVAGVVEEGYYLKDKVLRHARVIVSKLPENEDKLNE
jgi:molecular chaperone GrpE